MLRFFFRVRAFCVLNGAFLLAAWRTRKIVQRFAFLPGAQLDTHEQRRFRHYYFGSTYLASLMCCLRGRRLSHNEQELFGYLAALACFFDDLTDKYPAPTASPITKTADPETFGAEADHRGIALHLLHGIHQRLPAQNLRHFNALMHRVFKTETAGHQPNNLTDLLSIHAEKGGCSVLLFRSLMDEPLTQPEENAWFQFGALIQLSDDIFDLWHDHQAGIQTPATQLARLNSVEGMVAQFERQVLIARKAFYQTPHPVHRIETTLGMQFILESITRVCLKHYHKLLRQHGALPLHNRTMMVVDMEKIHNRLKVVRQWLYPIR